MRKIITMIVFGTILISYTAAQGIEITAFTGYSFNSQVNTYYGKYKVDDSQNYGGILGYELQPDMFVEFLYNRSDTRIDYYYQNSYNPVDMSTEYFQLGALKQMGAANLKPFGAASLGLARFNLKRATGDFAQEDYFFMAANLGGGVKILLGDRLGIRLQARLSMPMVFSGFFLTAGTGGAGASAGFRIPLVQFDLSAGLTLRL